MVITRRAFLKYCTASAATLGLTSVQLDALAGALASPTGPTVLWLQGSGCTGCSISFLDLISSEAPKDAGEVLIDVINLAYHPNLMGGAGNKAVTAARQAYYEGGYVLIVEGGVPTAFDGNACWAWTENGIDVTFEEAVKKYASRAAAVVCIGQCAAYGGFWSAPPNPTQVRSVKDVTGLTTINVAGCPPHPNSMVWVIARLVSGQNIPLDAYGRPQPLYNSIIHYSCPLRHLPEAHFFGQPNTCLEELGCRGPETRGTCATAYFNGGVNFCMGAGAPCIGCNEHDFPGTEPFFEIDD
jgi:hydrogenase small subunit